MGLSQRLVIAVVAPAIVMAVILILLIIPAIVSVVIPVIIVAVIAAIAHMRAMTLLVTGNILMVVPVVLHKVDPFAAGIVLMAVFAPVSGMAGRDVKVDWLAICHHSAYDNRLGIDNLRLRVVANVDATVKTGLPHTDRYADIGSKYRCRSCGQYGGE